MPYIHISTTETLGPEQEKQLKERLGRAITLIPGKSEDWLMLRFDGACRMSFRGKSDCPAAHVRLALHGQAGAYAFARLTEAITGHIKDVLQVPGEQLFIQYEETAHWGWNGKNF